MRSPASSTAQSPSGLMWENPVHTARTSTTSPRTQLFSPHQSPAPHAGIQGPPYLASLPSFTVSQDEPSFLSFPLPSPTPHSCPQSLCSVIPPPPSSLTAPPKPPPQSLWASWAQRFSSAPPSGLPVVSRFHSPNGVPGPLRQTWVGAGQAPGHGGLYTGPVCGSPSSLAGPGGAVPEAKAGERTTESQVQSLKQAL